MFLNNGNVIKAKVVKIVGDEISYRNYSDTNGTVLTIFSPDVLSINYENGVVQSFTPSNRQAQSQPKAQAQPKSQRSEQYSNTSIDKQNDGNYGQGKMEFIGLADGRMRLNGRSIDDYEVKGLLGYEDYYTYTSAKKQYKKGDRLVLNGWIFVVVGVSGFITGLTAVQEEWVFYVVSGSFALANIFLPIGYTLRGIGKGRLKWLADKYNSGGMLSQDISISLNPALVWTPNALGGNNYGLGAGITLRF